jgi:hypothetical protein
MLARLPPWTQSRDLISGIAVTAEERLREACAQVFAGVESLRERLVPPSHRQPLRRQKRRIRAAENISASRDSLLPFRPDIISKEQR